MRACFKHFRSFSTKPETRERCGLLNRFAASTMHWPTHEGSRAQPRSTVGRSLASPAPPSLGPPPPRAAASFLPRVSPSSLCRNRLPGGLFPWCGPLASVGVFLVSAGHAAALPSPAAAWSESGSYPATPRVRSASSRFPSSCSITAAPSSPRFKPRGGGGAARTDRRVPSTPRGTPFLARRRHGRTRPAGVDDGCRLEEGWVVELAVTERKIRRELEKPQNKNCEQLLTLVPLLFDCFVRCMVVQLGHFIPRGRCRIEIHDEYTVSPPSSI